MASLVRLIGVPTERPFPSVLGEPSKVTTATHPGQVFFAINNLIAEQRFQTVETGVEGAPRLSASATGLAPVRRTFQSYDWKSCLSTPSHVHVRAKKSLPVFHSGAPCCPAAVSRDGLVILRIDSQPVNPRGAIGSTVCASVLLDPNEIPLLLAFLHYEVPRINRVSRQQALLLVRDPPVVDRNATAANQ